MCAYVCAVNRIGLLFGLTDVSASLAGSSIFVSVGFDRLFSGFLRPKIFKSICINIFHTLATAPPSHHQLIHNNVSDGMSVKQCTFINDRGWEKKTYLCSRPAPNGERRPLMSGVSVVVVVLAIVGAWVVEVVVVVNASIVVNSSVVVSYLCGSSENWKKKTNCKM